MVSLKNPDNYSDIFLSCRNVLKKKCWTKLVFLLGHLKLNLGFSFKTSFVRDQLQMSFASLILRCRLVGSWRSQTGVPAPPLFLFIFSKETLQKTGNGKVFFSCLCIASTARTEERKGNFSYTKSRESPCYNSPSNSHYSKSQFFSNWFRCLHAYTKEKKLNLIIDLAYWKTPDSNNFLRSSSRKVQLHATLLQYFHWQ